MLAFVLCCYKNMNRIGLTFPFVDYKSIFIMLYIYCIKFYMINSQNNAATGIITKPSDIMNTFKNSHVILIFLTKQQQTQKPGHCYRQGTNPVLEQSINPTISSQLFSSTAFLSKYIKRILKQLFFNFWPNHFFLWRKSNFRSRVNFMIFSPPILIKRLVSIPLFNF